MRARKATVAGGTPGSPLSLSVDMDGAGTCGMSTGLASFDRLLSLFADNARMDILLEATGGPGLAAHTVGGIGHCLGQAVTEALGDKSGITRYAAAVIPVESSLARVVLDLSGRAHLEWSVPVAAEGPDGFDPHLALAFMRPFILAGGITMHVEVLEEGSPQNAFDAIFIAAGRALGDAVSRDPREKGIPSSKGVL